jgi:Spy/CpxP family protein refolding chaperone
MKRTRWISGLAATLLVAAVGCGSKTPATAEPATGGADDVAEAAPRGDVAQVGAGEDEDESTADLAEHHRHHHHGGFAMFIAMSLDSLNITPDQTAAIDKIRTDMLARMSAAHDAEKLVLLAVADGIAAGKIDPVKVDPAIAHVTHTAAGVHEAVADSLNALHATLTPPQRVALVDKVEAHFDVWQDTNAPDEPAARDAHGGQLGRLAKELELSPQQIEAIRASFTSSMSGVAKLERAEAEDHMKAFAAAFASDPFDAKTLASGAAVNAHMATWGITRTVHFYEAVVPVLTPEQRQKLADSVRRHANYQHNDITAELR